jgi:hypothetical protein
MKKNKWFKILSFALVAVTCFGFVGCKNKTEERQEPERAVFTDGIHDYTATSTQKDFIKNALSGAVLSLLDDDALAENLQREIRRFAVDDANRRIYDILMNVVRGSEQKRAKRGKHP